MRDVLVVLFWIWLLTALGVYAYRIYRRATQGPRAKAQAGPGDSAATEKGLRARLAQSPPPPLPEGPIEPRLPKALQGLPTPAGDLPDADAAPRSGSDPSAPDWSPSEVAAPARKATTLAEALEGITMPGDLLPIVEPGDRDLIDGRRARFAATGTNVATVAVALGEELRRLGYAVDGLDTITSDRAGLTATRDGISVAAKIRIDDDTGAVTLELDL